MNHIDVYHFFTQIAPKHNLTITQIQDYMLQNFQIKWDQSDHEMFLSQPPKTYQYCRYLKDHGYTNQAIQEILGITRQSISNAIQKSKSPASKEYKNQRLINKLNWAKHENPLDNFK